MCIRDRIQTGRRCIFWRSGSVTGSDGHEDRPAPTRVGETLVIEPLFFLISFTSGIPDYRRLGTWKTACSRSWNLESVSPGRMDHGGWQTRPGSTGGRGTTTWQPNSRTSSEGRRAYPAAPFVRPS